MIRTFAALLLLLAPVAAAPEDVPLIPRKILFGNPERAAVRLSPDGSALAFIAPVDGVMNVWVGPRDDPTRARAVTHDMDRGIRRYSWAYDSRHLLYSQDQDGNENYHVYALDLVTGVVRDLTPFPGVRAHIAGVSREFPHEILVGMNDRDERFHSLYRVDIRTGERTLVQENTGFTGFVTDDKYRVRFAGRMTADGGVEYLMPSDGKWEHFLTVPMEDAMTTHPVGFDESGLGMYMLDARGRDTAALVKVDLRTGEIATIAADDRADISDAMVDPEDKSIQAYAVNYERTEWTVLDPQIEEDWKVLRGLERADIEVTSRTKDDRWWTVAFLRDDGPVKYYLYDRQSKKAKFLFTNRSDLDGLELARMHPLVIQARDGLKLVSYLSLPPWRDEDQDARPDGGPLPMVLLVHGGPWARDGWGYDPSHQWLANRGYAVLSVNFRGSTGFGKRFLNAANREWAGKMHDDLLDAVDWAVQNGIAQEDRVAIMGGSYGGYATLVALTFTPDRFACGVDIVGPSSLLTLLETVPPYWKPQLEMFAARVGDPRTEEGRAFLKEHSPLSRVDEIRRPLLIGQGANDPRVKVTESEQIVAAMNAKEIPVVYVLYPDEGHGFARPANRMSFFAIVEAFFQPILGGRFEPFGEAFEKSSLQVRSGAELIPGLAEALPK